MDEIPDEKRREMLSSRLTPIHLYKLTPKTNCGKCGLEACLAFATQVVVGQKALDDCPFLDREAVEPFRERLREQLDAGIGLKRESFEKTLQFLRQELSKRDFAVIAGSLGAVLSGTVEKPALAFAYFGREISVTAEDIVPPEGMELDPWEKILIFIYVIGGATDSSGVWVGMEKLPNSISKIRSLKAHCEDPLAEGFAGRFDLLRKAVATWGEEVRLEEQGVDVAAEIKVLPKLSIRILWWDADPEEGFPCTTKFLFDSRVLQVLDLESLIFACMQITDRLLKR